MRVRPARLHPAMRLLASAASQTPPVPFYFNDLYDVQLPTTSSFPMAKYRLVREALQRELLESGLASFHESPLIGIEDLHTVHTPTYVERYLENQLTPLENRRIGFPWSKESVKRSLSSTGGTVAAMHAVCRPGATARFAGHVAGGTHHAFADRGEGFCVFSDIAVAAAVALRDYTARVTRILVVDLDVHQGNGNAVIFEDDPRVITFSMHCSGNLFSKREYSDYDVDLPVGAGDAEYLEVLKEHLPAIVERVRPQLIFFQAGVDPHASDRFGKLQLSSAGLKRRNKVVLDLAAEHQARLVTTMGGGYPKNLATDSEPFYHVVQAHLDCYRATASAHARLGWRTPWPWADASED